MVAGYLARALALQKNKVGNVRDFAALDEAERQIVVLGERQDGAIATHHSRRICAHLARRVDDRCLELLGCGNVVPQEVCARTLAIA